jgi:hypothetical protein
MIMKKKKAASRAAEVLGGLFLVEAMRREALHGVLLLLQTSDGRLGLYLEWARSNRVRSEAGIGLIEFVYVIGRLALGTIEMRLPFDPMAAGCELLKNFGGMERAGRCRRCR